MTNSTSILVADDHPLYRKGLADLVRSDSSLNLISEVADGGQALEVILKQQPDVAVLDVEMPKMSGLDVAREIKLAENIHTGIIVVTAYKDAEMFNEAFDLGVSGYVLKESAIHDILDGIRTVASGDQYISPSLAGLLLKRRAATNSLRTDTPGIDQLTPTERKILKLISLDRTSKEIANSMGISPRTVENHRANISRKVNVKGTHSLLKFAFQHRSKL